MLAEWLRGLRATLAGGGPVQAAGPGSAGLRFTPDDTLIGYLEHQPARAFALAHLDVAPAHTLERQGVRVLAPLLTQGRLVGLLGLGEPVAERVYAPDDLLFLGAVASAAAPAIRIAQLLARERPRVPRDAQRAADASGRP